MIAIEKVRKPPKSPKARAMPTSSRPNALLGRRPSALASAMVQRAFREPRFETVLARRRGIFFDQGAGVGDQLGAVGADPLHFLLATRVDRLLHRRLGPGGVLRADGDQAVLGH